MNEHRKRWLTYVRWSRSWPGIYVRKADRDGWTDHERGIEFSCRSFGRSLQYGGHRYKAYAHYINSTKPVPTKELCD